jgi:hydroxymethyl cephem carbamoyltransferase
MRLLSAKPGHDGSIAYVVDGELLFSFEAEKNSGCRFAPAGVTEVLDALQALTDMPDAFVLSGWSQGPDPLGPAIGAGYLGLEPPHVSTCSLLGSPITLLSSSHERSHLMGAYALSPFPQGQPCYALVWEGCIGAFYEIDATLAIRRLVNVMAGAGNRYAFAYSLVDPMFVAARGHIRLGDAGKLMALAAYAPPADDIEPTLSERTVLARICADPLAQPRLHKADFSDTPLHDCGVTSSAAKRLARLISERIFLWFLHAIRPCVTESRPLLISGGCGLNGEWNRRWRDTGLFTDIFVPPCANDSGSAIGSAADAQWQLTGNAKLDWDVYRGQAFIDDMHHATAPSLGPFVRASAPTPTSAAPHDDVDAIAATLQRGQVLGWVSGRAEIGPRALGNRSILAAPFDTAMRARLNGIKRREPFRPIAPVCLEDDAHQLFDLGRPSPHMLYVSRARSSALGAVTHVDGSARVQTVNAGQHPALHRLLRAFRERTGFGVLCNTSLNFQGAGFINRTSDLLRYARDNGLDGFVIDGVLFKREDALNGHEVFR